MITSKFCRLPVDLVYEKREAKTNQQQFDMNKQADKQTNKQTKTDDWREVPDNGQFG